MGFGPKVLPPDVPRDPAPRDRECEHDEHAQDTYTHHCVRNPSVHIVCNSWLNQPGESHACVVNEPLCPLEQVRGLVSSNGDGCRVVVEKFRLLQDVVVDIRTVQRNVDRVTVDNRQHKGAVVLLPPPLLSGSITTHNPSTSAFQYRLSLGTRARIFESKAASQHSNHTRSFTTHTLWG